MGGGSGHCGLAGLSAPASAGCVPAPPERGGVGTPACGRGSGWLYSRGGLSGKCGGGRLSILPPPPPPQVLLNDSVAEIPMHFSLYTIAGWKFMLMTQV